MNEHIQATINSLPAKPGIYLMKDASGAILYVGKATSLHSRVRSYFVDSADLSPKNRSMVSKVADIEYIVVGSEVEALILECNYIKQYRPKYNVLLRDDKNYPYIKVALTEDFPRVYRVRSFHHDGNRYFGPYTSSQGVDATLDLLNKLFPFRTCRYDASQWAPPTGTAPPPDWKPKYLARPCTQYYIHRCGAPCVGYVSREEYDAVIRQVILFLEGKHEAVIAELERRMMAAAEALQFEQAAALRDRIEAVRQVLEKQKIINTSGQGDQDVVALAAGDDETCAQVFFFRDGKLVGREYFILQGTRESAPGEIMGSFLTQFYDNAPHIPAELVLEHEPDDRAALEGWLRQKRGGAVTITVPRRGTKKQLVAMVAQNAQEVLEQQRIKWLSDSQKTALALEELQRALNLVAPPRRIECYDISNIQGTSSVGSMVVFEQGQPKTSDYRRFRIKAVVGADDFASHQEVLRRRFKHREQDLAPTGPTIQPGGAGILPARAGASPPNSLPVGGAEKAGAERMEPLGAEPDILAASAGDGELAAAAAGDGDSDASFGAMPDLIIVDGGKGQLNADLAVLDELGIQVPIVGLAKEHEEIFTPGSPDPIVLPRSSQGLYLVQRIRDEAHRFAITYHRQVRTGKTFRSVLDEVPGIGPKRKQALIRHFGSVRAIRQASVADLAAVGGMTRAAAERLKEHIGPA
jgi:excinuclease ABC subunit C